MFWLSNPRFFSKLTLAGSRSALSIPIGNADKPFDEPEHSVIVTTSGSTGIFGALTLYLPASSLIFSATKVLRFSFSVGTALGNSYISS